MAVASRLLRTTKKPVKIIQFEINNLIERGNQWTRYREAMHIMGMEHPIICTEAMQMMTNLSTGARVPITARDTVLSHFFEWSLQTGRSAVHRKAGKVAEISPLVVPGLDQELTFSRGTRRAQKA